MPMKSQSKKWSVHRILALNRGEKEKMLIVKIEAPDRPYPALSGKDRSLQRDNPVTTPVLTEVIADAVYKTDRTGDRA